MIPAKSCIALAVCLMVSAGMAGAHGSKSAHAKSAQTREEVELAKQAEHLKSRLDIIANVAGAIMSQGEGGEAGARMDSGIGTCFGGYMVTTCPGNVDAKSARNGH